jgi:hypothetical protein
MGISKSRKRTPSPRDGDSRVTWRLIRSLVSITRANASSWCSPNLERRCGCPSNTHSSRDTVPGRLEVGRRCVVARTGAECQFSRKDARARAHRQSRIHRDVTVHCRPHRVLGPAASAVGKAVEPGRCQYAWQGAGCICSRFWKSIGTVANALLAIGRSSKRECWTFTAGAARARGRADMSEAATELRLLDACRSWNMELSGGGRATVD